MKELLKTVAESILPASLHLPLRHCFRKMRGGLDPEMLHAGRLLARRRRFVDIGANVGGYAYYFSRTFAAVDAFEPIAEITHRLRSLKRRNVVTHDVALSSISGRLTFHIPVRNGKTVPPLASLEKREAPCEVREVEVRRLDDYGFDDVDLIKIDVEGHEYDVLEGAVGTIAKSRPVLLVEIEQRHSTRPIDRVFALIRDLGYDGYFLSGGRLTGLENFSYARDQAPYLDDLREPGRRHGRYVNNFIFVPSQAGGLMRR